MKLSKKQQKYLWIGIAGAIAVIAFFVIQWFFSFIAIIGMVILVSTFVYKNRQRITKFFSKRFKR